MVRRRKRKSRRRLEGRRILEHVPQFSLDSGEDKSVTAARKYIQAKSIPPPALLLVRRNEHTIDRFFWAEKGLFGAQYVEENHFLFPSLKEPEVEPTPKRATSTKSTAKASATSKAATQRTAASTTAVKAMAVAGAS